MDISPEHKYEFEYRFKIVGEKKMMSVGEYYMYNIVDVEVIGIDEKYKTVFKILGRDFDKSKLDYFDKFVFLNDTSGELF
jgi:hypothetical protein